jgi:hypothetical protein
MERLDFVSATPRSPSRRRLAAAGLALVAALAIAGGAPPADAAPVAVSTDPSGAHVRLTHRGVWVEVRGPRHGDGGGDARPTSGCLRRWVRATVPIYLRKNLPGSTTSPMPPPPGPGYVAYHVYCGADYVTSVWLPPNAFAPAGAVIDVRAIAEELLRDLPYPPATIGISPDGRGLTGLESWFWVVGYTGALRDAVDGFGMRVEVEATPASVRWDFGDGTTTVAGTLGRAAPARSEIVHTYEHRRGRAAPAVRATVRLDARYRVDGGPWEALDPVFRTATRGYPVAESRAALVRPR